MDATPEAIITYVAEQTQKQWDKTKSPYLVSFISPALTALGVKYREILGPEVRLARYLVENAESRFRVVVHPVHKAKIGLIPPDQHYEYATEVSNSPLVEQVPPSLRPRSKKYVILNFLEALSELETSELDKISIPVGVLVKLLFSK